MARLLQAPHSTDWPRRRQGRRDAPRPGSGPGWGEATVLPGGALSFLPTLGTGQRRERTPSGRLSTAVLSALQARFSLVLDPTPSGQISLVLGLLNKEVSVQGGSTEGSPEGQEERWARGEWTQPLEHQQAMWAQGTGQMDTPGGGWAGGHRYLILSAGQGGLAQPSPQTPAAAHQCPP